MIALKPENVVDVLFGNRLRQLLDERNISQAHFADRIGVSRSRMNNYVAQRSEPDYATLIRIANTLDTSCLLYTSRSRCRAPRCRSAGCPRKY